jgi:hypothetical protein
MHRRAAAATLAILLAACGGGDGDDTPTGSGGTEAGTEAGGEAPDAGGGDFCQDLEAFIAVSTDVTTALFDEDAPELTEALASYAEAAAAVEASVPPELADDVTTVAGAPDTPAAALDGVDVSDPAAVGAAFQAVEQRSPETEAAADRVSEYARAECGFDPDAVGDTGGESAVPESAEPPDACTFVDPQLVATAAGATVDVTDQDGSGDIDLGSVATKSCSYGNGQMTISTLTYAGDVEDARENFVDNVESNDGTVVTDVDLGTLPESTLVTETDGFTAINVLDAATPFGLGFANPIDAAALVAAAEAVLAQAG